MRPCHQRKSTPLARVGIRIISDDISTIDLNNFKYKLFKLLFQNI